MNLFSPRLKLHHPAGKSSFLFFTTVVLFALMACSHTENVRVDPRVNLDGYQSIGIIGFSGNSKDHIEPLATQKFMQSIMSAQPNVRLLELGTEDELLEDLHRQRLDPQSIKAIGEKYQIDALFSGDLLVSEVKPSFKLSSSLKKSLSAQAYIEGTLSTRLWETTNGATRWTRSTTGKKSVAKVNLTNMGSVNFGASDPEEKYGELIHNLVRTNTVDFYPYYEKRKVQK